MKFTIIKIIVLCIIASCCTLGIPIQVGFHGLSCGRATRAASLVGVLVKANRLVTTSGGCWLKSAGIGVLSSKTSCPSTVSPVQLIKHWSDCFEYEKFTEAKAQ